MAVAGGAVSAEGPGGLTPARGIARRIPLAVKFSIAFVALVTLVLLVNGAVNLWLAYGEARRAAVQVQQEKARAAAERIGQFVGDIESQIGWTTRSEWSRTSPEQRRYDFIRLLQHAPAITEVRFIDSDGKEQLKQSRLDPDVVGSGVDFAADPRFAEAVANKVWYGPINFRRGSEPYFTLSVAHARKPPSVTSVEVNLKLIWDVVTGIRVGDKGYAYIVDKSGKLLAHPDMSLVLRATDMTKLPQVERALANAADTTTESPAEIGRDMDGNAVLTAHSAIPKLGWTVFVQLPEAEALAPVVKAFWQTMALLALGLLLATLMGSLLAHRMLVPIRRLQTGAERLGAGDFDQRIDIRTGDEIETLADRFNSMAGKIKESYETLEGKVQARTREVTEALEYQTATSDVLNVISRSPSQVQPVLDTIVETAKRLGAAGQARIWMLEAGAFDLAAHTDADAGRIAYLKANPVATGNGSLAGRAVLERQTIHVADIKAVPGLESRVQASSGNLRTMLVVPLMREGAAIGVIAASRNKVQPFSTRQVDLLKSFADQAVIAIENARLFEEVQARTREVTQALEYQTATSDVLNVISKSPNQVQPVFDAIVATARRLCHAESAWILQLLDGKYHLRAKDGTRNPAFDEKLAANPLAADRTSITGRVALEGRTVHVANVGADRELTLGTDIVAERHGARLGVPLLRDGEVSGVIVLLRDKGQPFSTKEIGLVETFAEQAVIAVGNARLFEAEQTRTRELAASLQNLHATQDRLIQSEKLASLGQLTAGIAHEIKNPLNFVNNFADVSGELVDELTMALDPGKISLDTDTRAEVDELTAMLKANLAKVTQHGRRADSIVKNMLLHSRSGVGERRRVDLNATVEESLNLAYHGARAEKPGFNITLAKSFDPAAGQIEIFPQEFIRVLLNLISNGFYAATKRRNEGGEPGYEPTLAIVTRSLGDRVEIRIRDNGTGIPDEVKAKMFNPFFTTKPAGEGTGLGLSLSFDIVKQHGGTIEVATEPGAFTEFTITLPRDEAKANHV